MNRTAWLSTFLFAAMLSPIVLQSNDCIPSGNAELATLELWVDGANRIANFDPEYVVYEVSLPADSGTALLIFEAQEATAEVVVSYEAQQWTFQASSGQVSFDVLYSAGPLTIQVSVADYSRRHFVNIERAPIQLDGLSARVQVTRDVLGVPHIDAQTLEDAMRMYGYVVAEDGFFFLDRLRRGREGRLAELTGFTGDQTNDITARSYDWRRRVEERTLPLMTADELRLMQAYTDGINAWLERNPLPPEYADREIAQVRPWELSDTLLQGGQLGAHGYELGHTDTLHVYIAALGDTAGRALFFEDLARLAPMYAAATVSDAMSVGAKSARGTEARAPAPRIARPFNQEAASMIRAYVEELGPDAFEWDPFSGSNAWVISGQHTETGMPLLAGDGHNRIFAPNLQHESHLTVRNDPTFGRLNFSGTSWWHRGGPDWAVQSDRVSWVATSRTDADTCDYFIDRLVRGAEGCPDELCIESAGALHPVESRVETFQVNAFSDGVLDNMQAEVVTKEMLNVPFRSFGPVVSLVDESILEPGGAGETLATILQCTAFEGTTSIRAWLAMIAANDVFEFVDAARLETSHAMNFLAADTAGNIAHVASGEVPLRADLESGVVFGEMPFLVRDGSGPANWIPDPDKSQGQTLPYRIVPPEESPYAINPPAGFMANTNNESFGLGHDNDLSNDYRSSNPSAVYYLGRSPDAGLRAGRINQLIRGRVDAGQKISADDVKAWQGNTQALEAELFVPFILAAWDHAQSAGAPPELAALATDAALAEAIARLASWDFSHPTGIPEGYDSSDVDGVRGSVPPDEVAHSVAATIYANWRHLFLGQTFDAGRASIGVSGVGARWGLHGLLHILSQEPFTGLGASGVDFFPTPAGLAPETRRDVTLLSSVQTAIAVLGSSLYQQAFGGSTDQDDYRWGRLARFRINDGWKGVKLIPPGAGFEDLGPGLIGMAREGAPYTLNVAGIPLRAFDDNDFVFDRAAMTRMVVSVGDPAAGDDPVLGWASIPGGNTADPSSPYFAAQLGSWLTVDYHRVPMNGTDVMAVADKVEVFGP